MPKRNQMLMSQWTAVYELSKNMLPPIEPSLSTMQMSAHVYLREMRTIHMGAGRQTGKTSWAIEQLLGEPKQILVVKDRMSKESLGEHWLARDMGLCDRAKERIFTLHDLRSMERTKPEVLADILSVCTRVFIDESTFQDVRSIRDVIAEHLPKDVIVVHIN